MCSDRFLSYIIHLVSRQRHIMLSLYIYVYSSNVTRKKLKKRNNEAGSFYFFQFSFNMAKNTCDNPKVDIPGYIISMFTIAAIILLVLGGNIYRRQHPKEINYGAANCLVLTVGYRNHTCKSKNWEHKCYSATWGVLHGRIQPINSIVDSGIKYHSLNETMNKTAEYQVNIGTIDVYRSLFYYLDAMT